MKSKTTNIRSGILLAVLVMAGVAGCATSKRERDAPQESKPAARGQTETEHNRTTEISPKDLNATTESSTVAETEEVFSIDLATALRLAEAEDYQIALAEERIVQAKAEMRQAQYLLLPTVSVGASQYHQKGKLQGTNGTTTEEERSGRMSGFGSGAVGSGLAGVPGVRATVDLAEAIFAPLAARQNANAVTAESLAVKHQTLLKVVLAYYELARAKARVAVARDSLRNAKELAETTSRFASTGEGLESDAERALVEKLVHERELAKANGTLRVQSVRLAEHLRLSQDTLLDPVEEDVVPVDIMSVDAPLKELIATALENRPEMNEHESLLKRADYRYKEARLDPFIPKLSAGYSTGKFGGSAGSSPGALEDRDEFGATIYWELEGLGLSFLQKKKARRSAQNQARLRLWDTREHIATQVREGVIRVQSQKRQLELASKAVEHALRSFKLNRARVFENLGLPIEVLQSLQSLALVRNIYVDAVVDYNESQYRLYVSLGQPPGSAIAKPARK